MAKFNLSPLLDSLAAAPAADLATSRWQGEMEAHAAALARREEAVARDEQQPAKLRVSKSEAPQPQQAATEPALDWSAPQKQSAMHAPQSLAEEAEALQQPQQPAKEALQQLQQASEALQQLQQASEALQQPQQQAKEAADEASEAETAPTLHISQDLKRALFNKMSAQVY